MSELADFLVHTATVAPPLGAGGLGPAWGTPVSVPCFVEDSTRLVRDAEGREVVSTTTLYDLDTTRRATYGPGALVTLPSGRTATVIDVAVHTSGALGLPDHLEVRLT